MKYLSLVVPCYNSAEYMEKCIDSLLIGKEDVEIIIIDDGSVDDTGKIADKYAKKYPKIVKAIHQKNGGHGEGINVGIKEATGKYFKVVDSDDWFEKKEYQKLLKSIKKLNSDLIMTNYVYTYADGTPDNVINYRNIFKDKCELKWEDTKRFKINQYLFIHSMIFKTSVVKDANVVLPKHCSYEDNLYIYSMLPYINTIYYLDLNLYRYFIGRADQSMNEANMIRKSKDQVLVSNLVCNKYKLSDIKDKKLRKIMQRECTMLVAAGIVFSRKAMTDEGEKQYKEMWKEIKEGNPELYKKIRHVSIAGWCSLPGKAGRRVAIWGYNMAHKIIKFN